MNASGPEPGIRVGRLTDCRGLGRLYASRSESDRTLFHPFPGGRWLGSFVFFLLLIAQGLYPLLVRLEPTWGFAFVVYPGPRRGSVDGFVYLRVRRRTTRGYVANIGTQVGPGARGKGVGPRMILAMAAEARRRGVAQIETQAYAWNSSSLRMGEKLGFHEPADAAFARQMTSRGVVITHVLDLDGRGTEAGPIGPMATSVIPGSAPPTVSPIRVARVSDARALGRLYSSRDETDRTLFHPFPGGRWSAPWLFFVLLVVQKLAPVLIRIRPSWAFAFIVYPSEAHGTLDGFVYLRGRRRIGGGYAANIGPQVSPNSRGKGIAPHMIERLIVVARTLGVRRFDIETYERNTASIRLFEKVGFRVVSVPADRARRDRFGAVVPLVMDLPPAPPGLEGNGGAGTPRWVTGVTAIALIVSFAVIVLLRLQILFSYPYPPGGDVAEQLYWSHIWLGTAFPSQVTIWWIPPVYIFSVYIPFTHLFPLFTGQRLLMGVVPALLLFPAYFLLRESEVSRPFSLFGAALLALAPPLSLMVTWNAGYNLFGMFCALIFFTGLVGALRTRKRSSMVLAAVGFGLTAGAHDFTFAFLCLGFVLTAALALLLLPDRRANGRTMGLIALGGALCAAPFALVYLTLTAQTSNVGGAVTSSALNTLFQGLFPFVWSGGTTWTTLIYVDTLFSVLGVLGLLLARTRRPETPVLLGILLAGVTLSAAYPQLPERGLYFVPLGLYPMIAVLFQVTWDFVTKPRDGRSAPTPSATDTPSVTGPSLRRTRRRGVATWVAGGIAVVIMAVMLVANTQVSLQAMQGGEQFYAELSPEDIPALNWLAENTSRSAAVFTPEPGLEKWIWGYANRQSYAPQPLSLQDTSLSYQATYLADMASLGQYVSTDPYLAVADNAPAPVGVPLIYLHSEYYWTLLFSTETQNVTIVATVGGQVVQANLANAVLQNETTITPCAGCTGQQYAYAWTGAPFTAYEDVNLTGENVTIAWWLVGATLDGVTLATYLTPPDFGTIHVALPRAVNSTGLTDHLSFGGSTFTVAFHGGANTTFSQVKLSSGWAVVTFSGKSSLRIQFSGLTPYGSGPATTIDSASVLRTLGVSYILTNYYDSVPGFGYIVYLRCTSADEYAGWNATEVFQSGGIYIFALGST